MLLVVLLLLLTAGGVLAAAVLADHPEWAWVSVVFCALGAAFLILERARRRRGQAVRRAAPGSDGTESEATLVGAPPATSEVPERGTVAEPPVEAGTPVDGAGHRVGWFSPAAVPEPGGAGAQDEAPAEEQTDAEDLRLVSRLERAVLVVDEHPRYHLAHCGWLRRRRSTPLPVREARELGFTPCARCMPDSTLAYRYRGPAWESFQDG